MGVVTQTAAKLAGSERKLKNRRVRLFAVDCLDLALEAVYHVFLLVLQLLLQLNLFLL